MLPKYYDGFAIQHGSATIVLEKPDEPNRYVAEFYQRSWILQAKIIVMSDVEPDLCILP